MKTVDYPVHIRSKTWPPAAWRAFAVWLIIIFGESVNGTFRELWLKPEIGGQIARFVSFFVALLLIYTITFLSIRWIRVTGTRHLLAIGIEWVVLTFVFEVTVARLALDVSWDNFRNEYDPTAGGLMPLGLLIMALAPAIAEKLRSLGTRREL